VFENRTYGNWLLWAPLIAVCVATGGASAKAGLLVEYRLDGGALTSLASSLVDSGPLLFGFGPPVGGVFDVNGIVTSNSPALPTLAQLVSTTLNITNLDTNAHTLELFITAQNFTSPTTPPSLLLDSQISGAASAGTTPVNALTVTSCIDTTNSAHACATPTTKAGPSTPSITAGALPEAFDREETAFVASLAGPYSVGQDLLVTLGGLGDEISYSWTSTVAVAVSPVPEPASLTMIGVGLLGLAAAHRRRA